MLGRHPQLAYIHEPFNLNYFPSDAGICQCHFPFWFTYITEENEENYLAALEKTLSFSYNFRRAIAHLIRPKVQCNSAKELAKIGRDFIYFETQKRKQARPLVKDPIALFSSEWLAAKFNMDAIVLVRHPAAFVGSLKSANWPFPFSHFLSQEKLIEDYLHPFVGEIEMYAQSKRDLVSQGILLWNIFHYVVLEFKKKHPDWIFIRYEDLAAHPIHEFRQLFQRLNLSYGQQIENYIRRYTEGEGSNKTSSLKACRQMNSRANIQSWKVRLTPSEIDTIRTETSQISSHFYTDADW